MPAQLFDFGCASCSRRHRHWLVGFGLGSIVPGLSGGGQLYLAQQCFDITAPARGFEKCYSGWDFDPGRDPAAGEIGH